MLSMMSTQTLERSKQKFSALEVVVAAVHRIAAGRDSNGTSLAMGAVLLYKRPELLRPLREQLLITNNTLAQLIGMSAANLSAAVNGHRHLSFDRAEALIKAMAAELAPERMN